jgi:hypothetical protein
MATRNIELDRTDLNKSIEVLSSAAQVLQLSRFESLSYRALMFSADVATVISIILIIDFIVIVVILSMGNPITGLTSLFAILVFPIILCILVGLVSLALSIPLFVRVFREKARLNKLGLNSLTRSLWIESRAWISRARSYLSIAISIIALISVATLFIGAPGDILDYLFAVLFALTAALLFAARYLRNQRERMILSANAEELKNALQGLRQRAGDVEIVAVPSELLEQTAKIESASIARERKDAVLRSITTPSKEYAVAFDRDAIEQRAKLDVADRIELEDLVEQLSAEAAESQAGGGTITAFRAATQGKRIEIDYTLDQTSHRIGITAVRLRVGDPSASPSGAAHD